MASPIVKQFPLEEEYKKKTGITPQDIAKFRKWLDTQPHLPGQYITDLDLILTYHCCNCSTSVSKQVLDLHYTLRTLIHAYFKDRDAHAIEQNLRTVLMCPLRMRARDGSVICYTRFLDNDPKNFNFANSARAMFMMLDLWQYEEGTWPGLILTLDFENVTLGHVAKLDLQNIQHTLYYLQEAMLVKLKGLHFINAPSFIDKVLMLMRPFLKKELMDVLHVHQLGSKTFDEFVPMEALPSDAGGSYMTLAECGESTAAKFKANNEFFLQENRKRVVESLRPGKPKTISDIFGGVEGSFKKLDID